jgi:NAD(P)-dependent dehydrogenase (short-subunit alcohol dehydrogenase family)
MPWTPDTIPDQSGRNAIVTGANSGIGLHTARILAEKGAHVIMACRNLDKANAAAEAMRRNNAALKLSVEQLNLSDLSSVLAFSEQFQAKNQTLDLLINNAGIMIPPYSQTTAGVELQFATNHLGHFALTGQLIGMLMATPHSRVVTVSSLAHRRGRIRFEDLNWSRSYNPWGAYGQSKLANLLFCFELDRRLQVTEATTTSIAAHPGFSSTNITTESSWMHPAAPLFGQPAERGAWPTLLAATAKEATGGSFWGPRWGLWGVPKRVGSSGRSRNTDTASRLWACSEELSGVHYLNPTN